MVVLLSVLVALTLFGVALIFIYYQKLFRLYRFQQNFINGFTHELKTPIASLRLYLDTFLKYDLSKEEQTQYLTYMLNDTERLNQNVNQILQIAKIEDKNFKPSFQKADIIELVKSVPIKNPHYFETLDISFKETSEKYEVDIVPDLIELVVMNLITNAVNYNESEDPKLEISFEKSDKYIVTTFKDNGIGLDKTEFKNVFKKMYQVGKSTKGSGLGLYLSHNVVKIHKGKLRVSSSGLGKGSAFCLYLPLPKDEQ